MVYILREKAKPVRVGHTMLYGMGDAEITPGAEEEAAWKPEEHSCFKAKDLYN